jgi:hypothetical protein
VSRALRGGRARAAVVVIIVVPRAVHVGIAGAKVEQVAVGGIGVVDAVAIRPDVLAIGAAAGELRLVDAESAVDEDDVVGVVGILVEELQRVDGGAGVIARGVPVDDRVELRLEGRSVGADRGAVIAGRCGVNGIGRFVLRAGIGREQRQRGAGAAAAA